MRLHRYLASFFSAVFLTESQSLKFQVSQDKKENKKNIHSCITPPSLKPTDQQKTQTWMIWLTVEALSSETLYQRAALSITALQMEKIFYLLLEEGV